MGMRRIVAGPLPLLLLVSQACSSAPQAEVIAADGALCDITRRLAASDLRVNCLLNGDADPHQLQLTPEQTRQLRQAPLVLINGYGLTPALNTLPTAVKVAEQAVPDSPKLSGHDAHNHHNDHGHSHGDRDPHVWHDPRQAAAMVALVSQQLQDLAPAHSSQIQARAKAMKSELEALHRWNQRQFATLPQPRVLASGHRAFASLARAYNLKELALLDATSSSATLRPQALTAVVEQLQRRRVRSLFAEQLPPPRTLERISSISGVPLAPRPLQADSAGDNLMTSLTGNTCLIVNSLGGRCNASGAAKLVQQWTAIR